MIITAKIIEAIQKQRGTSAEALAEALQDIGKIERGVAMIQKQKEKAYKDHALRIAGLGNELAAIQASCPHSETQFHGDPSGGRDSWTECTICGASV